jgi:hypothetical protein
MRRARWRSDGLIAWTEREGPGRPPAGPSRAVSTALGIGLAAVFTGILFTDTLCPEHRTWVQALASVAFVGTIVAAVGLIKRWAIAPPMALMVTLCGVSIGMLDAAHSAGRGRAIAAAFSLLALAAAVLLWRQFALVRWDRSVRRTIAPEPTPAVGLSATDSDPVESVVTRADDTATKADVPG